MSLLVVVVLAAMIGATMPLLLHRIGIDPALATGPFITTSNDILAVAVFFFAATRVYLP
jgi:magnesium transporter